MTKKAFWTYQKFSNKIQAAELSALLREHQIAFVFEDATAPFDPSYANNESHQEFRVKLQKQDFEKADQLMLHIAATQIEHIDKDYYLFQMTDEELIEVLTKRDEWSSLDYLLAQKILKDRGQEINEKFLETLRKQRISALAQPEGNQKPWIIAGYVFAFLGGLLGLFIGWSLFSYKKTLPNGDSVYGYSTTVRNHGKRIFVIGLIIFLMLLILQILEMDRSGAFY